MATVDIDQVSKLIDRLERDIARVRANQADTRKLLAEIEAIKKVLKSPAPEHSQVRERLRAIRQGIEHAAGTLSGELWRDAPYLAEIGRILGMP